MRQYIIVPIYFYHLNKTFFFFVNPLSASRKLNYLVSEIYLTHFLFCVITQDIPPWDLHFFLYTTLETETSFKEDLKQSFLYTECSQLSELCHPWKPVFHDFYFLRNCHILLHSNSLVGYVIPRQRYLYLPLLRIDTQKLLFACWDFQLQSLFWFLHNSKSYIKIWQYWSKGLSYPFGRVIMKSSTGEGLWSLVN